MGHLHEPKQSYTANSTQEGYENLGAETTSQFFHQGLCLTMFEHGNKCNKGVFQNQHKTKQ